MSRIEPWAHLPCERCGIEGQAARSEPKEGPYICSDCRSYEQGANDARRKTGDELAEDAREDARQKKESAVDHPAHYGGDANPYETIKVIEAWCLDFCLGNAVKYISRAGLKDPAKEVEDLEKARWYLDRAIANRKATKS